MALEVLLRRSIEGVGRVGEVVRVKNGYARNYLLPQGMAALVNAESLRRISQDTELEAVRDADFARECTLLAGKLAPVQLTIEARAGEDGHLYGSVGPRQIAAAFAALDHVFDERQLRIEMVRELGEYEVAVHLSKDHIVPVKVWVVQDARDAILMAEEAAQRAAAAAAAADEDGSAADGASDGADATP